MDDVAEPLVLQRERTSFEDLKRFVHSSRTFQRQYCSIYTARLASLKERVIREVNVKWPRHRIISLTDEIPESENEYYIVIGTLYKHQELKPSILRELSTELQLVQQPPRANYASPKDTLFLEDECQRIKLVGSHMDVQEVVTGIVCAILGRELPNGTFWVDDWCFPSYCPRPLSLQESKGKILFISGLNLARNVSLSLTLLLEWICGMAGSDEAQREEASVVRVIIAGNSVKEFDVMYDSRNYTERKAHDRSMSKEVVVSVHRLDEFLEQIVQCCSVTLMPGEFDPSCHTLPQQPFHPCIFPRSCRYKSFHVGTNPWIGKINSRIVAGSSGQPITDIMKVAGLVEESPIRWLEKTLKWQHFVPTAPDTLPAYPYFEQDPFVMTECPHVYFVGNMEKYDSELITVEGQAVRLICIPKFSETNTAVLVNLEDLETCPISFGVNE